MANKTISRKLEGHRSTKAIYGVILITAALIGFQLHETDPLTLSIKIFVAGLVIVLAEVYSEILGEKIRRKKELDKQERREIIDDTKVITSVALVPTLIFLLCELGLYDISLAFDVCFLLSILSLGYFGFIASQAAGDSRNSSLRKALVTASLGAAVIILKYVFTH
jgi:hypothetical protein